MTGTGAVPTGAALRTEPGAPRAGWASEGRSRIPSGASPYGCRRARGERGRDRARVQQLRPEPTSAVRDVRAVRARDAPSVRSTALYVETRSGLGLQVAEPVQVTAEEAPGEGRGWFFARGCVRLLSRGESPGREVAVTRIVDDVDRLRKCVGVVMTDAAD